MGGPSECCRHCSGGAPVLNMPPARAGVAARRAALGCQWRGSASASLAGRADEATDTAAATSTAGESRGSSRVHPAETIGLRVGPQASSTGSGRVMRTSLLVRCEGRAQRTEADVGAWSRGDAGAIGVGDVTVRCSKQNVLDIGMRSMRRCVSLVRLGEVRLGSRRCGCEPYQSLYASARACQQLSADTACQRCPG
jgi:hypothetical protein